MLESTVVIEVPLSVLEAPVFVAKDTRPSFSQPDKTLPRASSIISAPPSNSPSPSTPPPDSTRVFDVLPAVPLGRAARYVAIALVLLANLVQYTSNFLTLGAGPEFSRTFGRDASPGQSTWMVAGYSITQSTIVLISGRLGAIYGHKRLLLIGLALMAVASLANGFSTNYYAFIACRSVTGIGGGLLMPNVVALLAIMAPPGRSRNVALGFVGASAPTGGWIGAFMSGMVFKYTEWKWMFFITAILAAICCAGLWMLVPKERPVDKDGQVDVVGACTGISSLILFNFVWNQAPTVGWSEPYEIACLVLSLALFAVFLVWEHRWATAPIMPLSIFSGAPTFTALVFVVLLTYMSFGISQWYMIAWLEQVRGWSVLHLAVGWIPFCVCAICAVSFAAWLMPRLAAQWILAIGVVAVLASNLLLATMPRHQTYWAQTFPAIVASSVCPDFVFVAAQIIASNSVGRRQQGVAGSLIATINMYGSCLGLGFAGTIEASLTGVWASGKGASASHSTTAVPNLRGYRAALYFGASLALAALVLDFVFVRVPKDDREGWDSDEEEEASAREEPSRGMTTGI